MWKHVQMLTLNNFITFEKIKLPTMSIKNTFDKATFQENLQRIENLKPETKTATKFNFGTVFSFGACFHVVINIVVIP